MHALRTLLWLSAAAVACTSPSRVEVVGGTLELNPRLRADLGPTEGLASGRFYADGACAGGSALEECRFVSPLRSSTLDPSYVHRLRRSEILWVEDAGAPVLSYELIAREITLREVGGAVLASEVTAGTCHGFPSLDPETRRPLAALEDHVFAGTDAFLRRFDVMVRACVASTASVSESLEPVTSGCTDTSVAARLGDAPPGAPSSPPCVIGLHLGAPSGDASYSLWPQPAAAYWPELELHALPISPHLKLVPVGGTRTLSRPLIRNPRADKLNPDGSTTYAYAWRVDLEGEGWKENFSPNLRVRRARVRRGGLRDPARRHLSVEVLEVANLECKVRDDARGHTEFDVPRCGRGEEGELAVTPTYRVLFLEQGAVDDGQRLIWDARLRAPAGAEPEQDLYLELDVTAVATRS